jgi:hypothetical protein
VYAEWQLQAIEHWAQRLIIMIRHAYPPGVGILWQHLPESAFDAIFGACP